MEENIINTSTNTYVSASETTIKLSELCFLAYWSLMLFAKAVGWYDGQTIYKIVLVISIAFWAVKMALTKYSLLEYVIILGLLGLSGAIYLVSGEKGIVICMMTMLGVKNLDIKRILKVGIVVWGGTYIAKFVFCLINFDNVTTGIFNKIFIGYIRRIYMGYSHPNVLHISFLMLTTLIVCYYGEKITKEVLGLLFLGNIVVFFYSIGITGAVTTGIYLVLIYIFRNRKMGKIVKIIGFSIFPILLILSLVFPIALTGNAFKVADKLFNNRMALANHFLSGGYVNFFGNNLAQITDSKITMDNSYVFSLIIYGLLMFIIICAGYLLMIWKQLREDKNIELITTLCLLLGGLSEPYLFNTSFKNISLLFLGVLVFECTAKISKKEIGLFSGLDKDIEVMYLLKKRGFMKDFSLNLFEFSRVSPKWTVLFSIILTSIFTILYWLINPPGITEGYGYVLYFDMVRNILTFFYAVLLITTVVLGMRAKWLKKRSRNGK